MFDLSFLALCLPIIFFKMIRILLLFDVSYVIRTGWTARFIPLSLLSYFFQDQFYYDSILRVYFLLGSRRNMRKGVRDTFPPRF